MLPKRHKATELNVLNDTTEYELPEVMMFLKRALMAGAMVLTTAVAANAADIPMMPEPVAPAPPPAPTFNWAGPYVGAYGGYLFGPNFFQIGGQAGYNFVSGGFLGGAEIQAGAIIAGGVAFEGNLNARIGAILGSNFLLYGEAGVGTFAFTTFTYTFGGGVEVGVGSSTSLFVETKGLGAFGGGCCAITVQTGVNFHL
jgi:opacity protein-like surface antigen